MNNPHLVRKNSDPTNAPPEAGIHWVNITTGKEFFSVGTSTVNDWVERNPAFTGAISSVTNSNLNNNIVVVSNGSGKIASSTVSTTTLAYLDATSSVQTQINSKANSADVIKKDGSVAFTADQSMGTHKITNVVDPSSAQDAATKNYVDNLITGLDWKEACHTATVSNINLSSAPSSVDGHTLNTGDRVLVKNQSTAADNGIYVFNGAGSAMTRALDADTWNEIVHAIVFIEAGTSNANTKWNNTNVAGGTLGVTNITFTVFSSSSSISGAGTADYNTYWTSSGTIAGEQYVASSRGGLGADASAFSGVVKSSAGSFSASALVNADVSATAAINYSKMAALTASKAMVTDGSGVASVSSVSATELGYLSGVSSGIQGQINSKQDTITGAASSVTSSNLTASKALVSDASGKISDSVTTAAEIGYISGLSSAVQTQLNGKEPTLTKGNLTESVSSVLTISGGSSSIIGSGTSIQVKKASASQAGYLDSNDFSTFNSKEPALTKGNLTEATSSILTITGGTNSVIGSGTSIQVKQASASQDGYLSSADWSTFNSAVPFIPPYSALETPRGYTWQNNSTTISTDDIAAGSATGSVSAKAVATTNTLTRQVRASYSVSTPAANGACGYRSTAALWAMTGGFRFKIGFGHSDSQYNSGARQFYGMTATTGALGLSSTVTVDSLLNMIGIGSDAADTNLQIFYNDGSGTASKIDLGANFPANRTAGAAATDWFTLELYNVQNSSDVLYRAISYATLTTVTGTLSTNLPSSTTLLAFQANRTSGASSNQCSFDISEMYCCSLS